MINQGVSDRNPSACMSYHCTVAVPAIGLCQVEFQPQGPYQRILSIDLFVSSNHLIESLRNMLAKGVQGWSNMEFSIYMYMHADKLGFRVPAAVCAWCGG